VSTPVTTRAADICIIEDDAAQRKVLARHLKRFRYRILEADGGADGLRLVYRNRPRIVICDLLLPDLDGIQICRHIRSDPSLDGTYIIVITACDTRERKHDALNAGADDYLQKPYDFAELKARIRNGMRFHRLHEGLLHAALTDSLTELWNHAHFRQLLDHEFSRTRRYGGCLSLLMADLDHFKALNDMYGHEFGNKILRLTARHLERTCRASDIVARYGGEEFAVICPETRLDEAAQLAERLRASLPDAVRTAEHPNSVVNVSFGVVSSSDPRCGSVSEMIELADRALYVSKRCGRDRVTRCDQMTGAPLAPEPAVDEVDRLRKEVVALSLRSKETCLQSIWALIQALDARDRYSAWHSQNVTLYTRWLVSAAGWPEPLRETVANAAMLHDLGRIGLSDELLNKPGALDPLESGVMIEVPQITCRILEPLRVFESEIAIIRHLRERYDGSGWPHSLKGECIPIGSRMLAIAEAFDSITCNRAYRAGRSIDEALAELRRASGTQFDPAFVRLLAENIAENRSRWQAQIDRAQVELPGMVSRQLLVAV
jgi:diguanylate cyclase (GGDEF)-like protein